MSSSLGVMGFGEVVLVIVSADVSTARSRGSAASGACRLYCRRWFCEAFHLDVSCKLLPALLALRGSKVRNEEAMMVVVDEKQVQLPLRQPVQLYITCADSNGS